MTLMSIIESIHSKKKKLDTFILRQHKELLNVDNDKKEFKKEQMYRKKRTNAKYTQDIFEMHSRILKMFDDEYKNIENLNNEIEKLEWIYEHSTNEKEKQSAKETMQRIQKDKYLLESGVREAHYLFRAEPLLKRYETILNKPIRVSFTGNDRNDTYKEKHNIIMEYINIAKHYINIKPIHYLEENFTCDNCKIDLQTADELLFVCPSCGYAVKNLASIASYQDNNRINNAQRYYYEKRTHFSDSIKKYQGKQNTTIQEKVYDDLRRKIHNHGIPIKKLTKDHIYEFLKSTGHNEHYEDINLIYYVLTDNKPPDISHLETKLFELFDEIDPIYERIKPADRVNFLNGQYVLFKFLQKLRYPCKEDDFYILKTRDKMLEHDEIWKRICEEKKWTFKATV